MERDEEKESIILSKSINKQRIESLGIESKKEKKRYFILDNIKGILIFSVVFAHFLWGYSLYHKNSLSGKIVVFIYCFHMHVFIFISGFLSSENNTKISNATKLLILYYIFNYFFSITIKYYNNSLINFFYPKRSYWYLLSLFYWRISIKYINKIYFIVPISFIISLLVGYFGYLTNILSIVRTIVYFPFFLVGYKISKLNIFIQFLKWRKGVFKYIIFLICFLFFLFLFIVFINSNYISYNALLGFNYNKRNTLTIRIKIFIIAFAMALFFFLLIPNRKIPLINKWGKNSLYIIKV